MRILHPNGNIDQRKLEEYKKRAVLFSREGQIRGFYNNPDDPQGITIGKNSNIQGFHKADDYTGDLYLPQKPLEHEYQTDPPSSNFQPFPYEFQPQQRISKRWVAERMADKLEILGDTSAYNNMVNSADHLKVPTGNMSVNLSQLHLTPEEKRIWGLDGDEKFKPKEKENEDDFNPYAQGNEGRRLDKQRQDMRNKQSSVGKWGGIDRDIIRL